MFMFMVSFLCSMPRACLIACIYISVRCSIYVCTLGNLPFAKQALSEAFTASKIRIRQKILQPSPADKG